MILTRFTARARSLCLALGFLLGGAASAHAQAGYQLEPAYLNLLFVYPTDMQPANDGTNRMFVVEKRGVIWVFDSDYTASTRKVFLNKIGQVRNAGEAGLLGLAFDPNYRNNGYFYLFYITEIPTRTIVARYSVSSDPDVADPNSEVILIDIPQPTVFHNGGQLEFGDDGYLYIAMGDNRITENAQDLTVLPGSILRIDVKADPAPLAFPPDVPHYQIPPDNPFVGNTAGYRPEIYAYGFRNPWRFSLDHRTGELWACDVGEDKYEEIDIVYPGKNYGWPLMEGPSCYLPAVCDTAGKDLQPPLYAYMHNEGDAIVGGCRYWGTRLPELTGVFIFADYTSHMIWGLHYDGAGVPERFDLAPHGHIMLTVSTGFNGEVLIGALDGYIYRLGRASTSAPPLKTRSRLLGNYPNPFNPSTTIRFTLASPADVRLDIVSAAGERVRQIDFAHADAGPHEVQWKGDTETGSQVASGVYFCRLIVDGTAVDSARMVLVQ